MSSKVEQELSERNPQLELVTMCSSEHLLQHLSRRRLPQTDALHLEELAPGAWPALWASLRDVKDATIDSRVRAVEEGQFAAEDEPKLKRDYLPCLRQSGKGRQRWESGRRTIWRALVTEEAPELTLPESSPAGCGTTVPTTWTQNAIDSAGNSGRLISCDGVLPVGRRPVMPSRNSFSAAPLSDGRNGAAASSSLQTNLFDWAETNVSVEVRKCRAWTMN